MRRSAGWLLTAALVVPGAGCLTGGRQPTEPINKPATSPAETKTESQLPPNKTADIMIAAAVLLEKKGEPAKALASYEQARGVDPSCGDRIAHRLAVLYDQTDQTSKAGPEYQRALKLAPKDANLLNDFGYHWYCIGKWTEAEKCFRQALALDASHTRAHTNLGLALAQQGRDEEALETFGKVVAPADALANLGFVLLARGRRDDARAAYRQALALDPNSRVARAALARFDEAAADPATAVPPSSALGGPSEPAAN